MNFVGYELWLVELFCISEISRREKSTIAKKICETKFFRKIFISLRVPFFVRRFFSIFLVLSHHQYLLSFPFFISFISITKLHSFFTSFSWDYFPHDHARSRAYRWGEDGLLGISDEECRLCFGLALWNEKDPILKERLFGLTGNEGTISVIILKENILEKKYRILQHK